MSVYYLAEMFMCEALSVSVVYRHIADYGAVWYVAVDRPEERETWEEQYAAYKA